MGVTGETETAGVGLVEPPMTHDGGKVGAAEFGREKERERVSYKPTGVGLRRRDVT